ncbi:MAG TPA: sulfate adenylyltransferase subunit CysD [Acidimicrobiales bacterium]|nr:sulfate adenylyltransferase subunit CysD [Acidimicrobiales bacterium]
MADLLTHLDALESESVHIIREVVAEFERPSLLFSGGKDSAVLLHLAVKACWPQPIPFPVVHIDTGQNFEEVIAFRDMRIAELGCRLLVERVQDAIDRGDVVDDPALGSTRNRLQTHSLLKVIEDGRFDAVFGGARRDEEKARAKERMFSFRDEFGQWNPRGQRPEIWNLFNGRHGSGEHFRIFPLSNWTELDIWQYIAQEKIELPSIYYAHVRKVVCRDNMLIGVGPYTEPRKGEKIFEMMVRYRTVGDMTCTAAVESDALDPQMVIAETMVARFSERGATRTDDRFSEAAMEDRKREGYF